MTTSPLVGTRCSHHLSQGAKGSACVSCYSAFKMAWFQCCNFYVDFDLLLWLTVKERKNQAQAVHMTPAIEIVCIALDIQFEAP